MKTAPSARTEATKQSKRKHRVLNWTRATPEIDLAAYPNVKTYLERMRKRPSVAAALALEVPLYQAEIARRKAA
jgi:glutathione S-transferase